MISIYLLLDCYKKSWDCTSDVLVNNRDVTIKKKEEGISAFLLFLLVAVKKLLSCLLSLCSLFCLRSLLNGSLYSSVLSYDLNRNLNLNLLVEVDCSLEVTNVLDIAHCDDLAINLDALVLQLLSYDSSVN